MKHARGFTLVEILAALAVLAIAMAAILSGMARYADTAGRLKAQTVALWVAHNRLTELELQPQWPALGRSDGEVEMAGAEWTWRAEVKTTPDERLRRVDIRVSRTDDDETDLVSLSAFMADRGGTP